MGVSGFEDFTCTKCGKREYFVSRLQKNGQFIFVCSECYTYHNASDYAPKEQWYVVFQKDYGLYNPDNSLKDSENFRHGPYPSLEHAQLAAVAEFVSVYVEDESAFMLVCLDNKRDMKDFRVWTPDPEAISEIAEIQNNRDDLPLLISYLKDPTARRVLEKMLKTE